MKFLNERGCALVVVSNGPHQVVSNLLPRLHLQEQISPDGMKKIKTPVIANLLVCRQPDCSQQLQCGECVTSFVTAHGAVGVEKGDIVRRLAAALPVKFATGDSVGGDSRMLLETVQLGGSALIRPSENPDGTYNNNLLMWARLNLPGSGTMPVSPYAGFKSYQEIATYAVSKLETPLSGMRLPLKRKP
jgi:hypothetical protein